jgi:hypothetical protein
MALLLTDAHRSFTPRFLVAGRGARGHFVNVAAADADVESPTSDDAVCQRVEPTARRALRSCGSISYERAATRRKLAS